MKVKRSLQDSIVSLQDEQAFLRQVCQLFDNGDEKIAKKIALSLRILLHDSRNSISILSQLKIKDITKFLDTAHPYNEKNLLPSSCLTEMRVSSNIDIILPLLKTFDKRIYKDFSSWWYQTVLDDRTYKFSRKDIILLVANKDGGAHIDPELPEDYYNLTRNNSMGWMVRIGQTEKPLRDFCLASVRQIGFEVDETLNALRTDLWRY